MLFRHLIENSRFRDRGRYTIHANIGFRQFLTERLGKPDHTRFSRTICGCIRIALLPATDAIFTIRP